LPCASHRPRTGPPTHPQSRKWVWQVALQNKGSNAVRVDICDYSGREDPMNLCVCRQPIQTTTMVATGWSAPLSQYFAPRSPLLQAAFVTHGHAANDAS
jgi:hypothetical protein